MCFVILEHTWNIANESFYHYYRYVSDVARRVGEATTTSRSVSDLFSTHIEVQRQKLRDNCEKLLFLDPLNHGKKSLELLWRKVYYDTVSAAKKLRESDDSSDSYLFSHIVCGIGQFHHFISRLQSEMKVHIKELDYIPLHNDEEAENGPEQSEEQLLFGRSALHTCLIYLGDLSRYQSEIFHTFDPSIAARYYLQAAHIDMSSGMPYNQLGNLYMDKDYNLDSVCYYIHCMSCATPFEGAMGNLTKIFEKNNQFCEALKDAETLTQTEHIQNTVANYLSLIEIWYLSKNDTNIPQRCNEIAQELKIAMDFYMTPLPDINKNFDEYTQMLEEENVNPSYLNGNLVHKMVQICLFTIAKMNEIDEQKAFACKAFTLALLAQLLQKLQKQLETIGFVNPASNYKPRVAIQEIEPEEVKPKESNETVSEILITNGTVEHHEDNKENDVDEENGKQLQNGETKSPAKKAMTKRRRRRRVMSSESSDMSDTETQTSDVESEEIVSDDDLSDSTYQSEDDSKSEGSLYDGSDVEDVPEQVNGDTIEGTNKDTTKEMIKNTKEEKTKSKDREELNESELQNFLFGDNFLPSIKLLLDWILLEKELILSCGDSGESLFQCVVDLLNIFTHYFSSKTLNDSNKECKILGYARNVAKNLKLEFKTIPLPEDINLRGTNVCKFDKDAAEWQILDRYKPSAYEENVIRILNFIDFGNQIAKIVPRIRFNRTMKIFYLKKITHSKLSSKLSHKKSREWHNSKKQTVSFTLLFTSSGYNMFYYFCVFYTV